MILQTSRSWPLLLLVMACSSSSVTPDAEEGGLFERILLSTTEPAAGLHAQLAFDGEHLRYVGVRAVGGLALVDGALDGDTTLHVGALGAEAVSGDVVEVIFAAHSATTGSAQRAVHLVEARDEQGAAIELAIEQDSFLEQDPLSDRHFVAPLHVASNMGDESVMLSATMALDPTFADYPLGDVSRDGQVSIVDAHQILRIAMHKEAPPASALELYHADLNGDGRIDATDALAALQKAIDPHLAASPVVYPPFVVAGDSDPLVALLQNAGNMPLPQTDVTVLGYPGVDASVSARTHGSAVLIETEPQTHTTASASLRLRSGAREAGWIYVVQPAELMDLYLSMDQDDLDLLYSRPVQSDDRLPGTMRLSPDGEELELRGLRFRGNTSRNLIKKGFNIRFEDRQDFLYGSSRMNINAMFTDPSMMKERLSMDMFRDLGQPSSRARYFNLYINGVYEGLYVHLERVDEDLFDNAGFNPEGTIVRDQFRDYRGSDARIDSDSFFGFDIDSVSDPEAFLESRTNYRGEPDFSALATLLRWARDIEPGPTFAREFEERIDVDNFVDWLAIHFLIADNDSFGDDYWLYFDHHDSQARWHFVPWDKDLTFGSHWRRSLGTSTDFFSYESALDDLWGNHLVTSFLATPALMDRLTERMMVLMHDVLGPGYFQSKSLGLAHLIRESVNRGPEPGRFELHGQNHHGELGRHGAHVDALTDFVLLRYGFVEADTQGPRADAYTATVDISDVRPGERVRFVGSQGWTIGELTIHGHMGVDQVTLVVREQGGLDGIDRQWSLEAGGLLQGRLVLYYRNDVAPELGQENWYAEDHAIGRQWELQMVQLVDEEPTYLPSAVNAYSNRVGANVSVVGRADLQLLHGGLD